MDRSNRSEYVIQQTWIFSIHSHVTNGMFVKTECFLFVSLFANMICLKKYYSSQYIIDMRLHYFLIFFLLDIRGKSNLFGRVLMSVE